MNLYQIEYAVRVMCLLAMLLLIPVLMIEDARQKHVARVAVDKLRNNINNSWFRNNNDLWAEHVMSYCDDASLCKLALADRKRRNISATIRQLQRKQSMETVLLNMVQEFIIPHLDCLSYKCERERSDAANPAWI